MKARIYDLTNMRFGKLTAIRIVSINRYGKVWHCECDCGGNKSIRHSHLTSGNTKSCGCVYSFMGKTPQKSQIAKNGTEIRKIYDVWRAMRQRCYNPNCKDYRLYGERGISVCDRWLNSFDSFYADMGEKPSPSHSIDRINNDGNYEPSNCRWATKKEQLLNRRKEFMPTIHTVSDAPN